LTKSQKVAFSQFINDPTSTMEGVVAELDLMRMDLRYLATAMEEFNEMDNDGNRVMALSLAKLVGNFQKWKVISMPLSRPAPVAMPA